MGILTNVAAILAILEANSMEEKKSKNNEKFKNKNDEGRKATEKHKN